MRKVKYDKFGFEVLEYDEPMDYSTTDDYTDDELESDGVCWWRGDCSFDDEYSNED